MGDPRYVDAAATAGWILDSPSLLIVVGAGLSLAAPASVPSVVAFQTLVADALESFAGYTPIDSDYRKRLFPEALYGAIAEAYETKEHLRIWEVLDATHAAQFGSRPNLGHLAVANLGGEQGRAIITTNFDEHIELAAAELGLDLRACVPDGTSIPICTQRGGVDLVKVHGTASRATEVKSLASDLSKSHRGIRALRWDAMPERLLVIGYSGRDFDLFPWLRDAFQPSQVLWIDPRFSEDHRGTSLGEIYVHRGLWEDVAGHLYPGLLARSRLSYPATSDQYGQAVAEAVEAHCVELMRSHSREVAVAALMGVLCSTGAHEDARMLADVQLAKCHPPTKHAARARNQVLLWAAHAAASTDRFTSAARHAKQALSLSFHQLQPHDWGRAAIALAYARVSDLWLTVPEVPIGTPTPSRLAALAWPIGVTVATTPLALRSLVLLAKSRTSSPQVPEYRFTTEYLEHSIRLMAFISRGGGTAIPASSVRMLWRTLSLACSAVGYTVGVFNVAKYTTRTSTDLESVAATIAAGKVLGDQVGQVIAERDGALRYLALAAEGAPTQDTYRLARQHFIRALETSRQSGSVSLELKLLVLMRINGFLEPLPGGSVSMLLSGVEARGLVAQSAHLQRLLETSGTTHDSYPAAWDRQTIGWSRLN